MKFECFCTKRSSLQSHYLGRPEKSVGHIPLGHYQDRDTLPHCYSGLDKKILDIRRVGCGKDNNRGIHVDRLLR